MSIRTDLRRSWLSRRRLAVAGTLCGVGLGKLKLIAGSEMVRPLMNALTIKAMEREIRELRQANEILRKASAYFAQAPLAV
jgi:transposase-like protein